jgi:hypothetical protein
MAKKKTAKTAAPGDKIPYDLVPRERVPKRMNPRSQQWKQMIEKAIETARRSTKSGKKEDHKAAVIRDLKGRTRRGIMSSLSGFVNRHPDIVQGYKIRTQTGLDGELYVWAEPVAR